MTESVGKGSVVRWFISPIKSHYFPAVTRAGSGPATKVDNLDIYIIVYSRMEFKDNCCLLRPYAF